MKIQRWEGIFLCIILLFQILLYLPVVGRGFIKDDFNWLENVVREGNVDLAHPFKHTTGFFRPMVGLTFGVQYLFFGMSPLPYGLFNLIVHLLNIVLVYILLKELFESRRYALIVAAMFSFNAKANMMAVGWISGRTALLYSFFLLSAFCLHFKIWKNFGVNSGKKTAKNVAWIIIAVLYLFALLSKETALAVPVFIFLIVLLIIKNASLAERIFRALKQTVVYLAVIPVYFALRLQSDAFFPSEAPDYYRLSFSPLSIIKNIFEYLGRGGLYDLIICCALLGFMIGVREGKRFPKINWEQVYLGLFWFLTMIFLYLLVPYRSDLYAYFPQIGLHIAAGVFISAVLRVNAALSQKTFYLLVAVLVILTSIWLLYLFQKASYIAERGRNSSVFVKEVIVAVSGLENESHIYILDTNPSNPFSPTKTVSYGFGAMLNLYFSKKGFKGEILNSKAAFIDKCRYSYCYYWEKRILKRWF